MHVIRLQTSLPKVTGQASPGLRLTLKSCPDILSQNYLVTNLTSHGAFIRYKPRSQDNKINEERICSVVKGLKYTKVQFASKIVFQFFVCFCWLKEGLPDWGERIQNANSQPETFEKYTVLKLGSSNSSRNQ